MKENFETEREKNAGRLYLNDGAPEASTEREDKVL
jgi:hypothetical protein